MKVADKPKQPQPGENVESTEIRRIDRRYLVDAILSVFYLEKGLLLTMKMLILKPGQAIRDFLFTENRKYYTKPLGFLILSSSVAAIIAISLSDGSSLLFGGLNNEEKTNLQEVISESGDEGAQPDETAERASEEEKARKKKEQETFLNYYSQNFNLLLILYVPISALGCYLFFRKEKWYYPEHLTSNAFLASMQNVLSIPFFIFDFFSPVILGIYVVLMLIYQVYFYMKVYRSASGFRGFLRAAGVILVSLIGYTLVINIIGIALMVMITAY